MHSDKLQANLGQKVKNYPLVLSKITAKLATLLLLVASISTALADQITLTYVDADSNEQTLTVDAESSDEDLALAASLMNLEGVVVTYDPDNGSGTLAEIAGAMAAASPTLAAIITETLVAAAPEESEAIVAAVSEVPGVDVIAVEAAAESVVTGTESTDPGEAGPTEDDAPPPEEDVPPPAADVPPPAADPPPPPVFEPVPPEDPASDS